MDPADLSSRGKPPSAGEVVAYHTVVKQLARQLDAPGLSPATCAALVEQHLTLPEATPVLAATGQSAQELRDRACHEYERYTPARARTALSPAQEVAVLLLQQVDLAWWPSAPDFPDPESVRTSADLVDVSCGGRARFRFALASDRLVHRARNYAVRRWLPARRPGTAGVSFPYARPELVRLLNAISDDLRRSGGPELWVNSLTRPVDQQLRLRQLGFTAHLPSAHCRGWAADVEIAWYDTIGQRSRVEGLLGEYAAAGRLNAIDEGRIWHVCPSPTFVAECKSGNGEAEEP